MEESAFASIRVRRYGNLRVTFTPELKILAYDFNVVTIDHSFPNAFVRSEMRALEQVRHAHASPVSGQWNVLKTHTSSEGNHEACLAACLLRV